MIIHSANTRGLGDHGWLKSLHTFSFADYYDPGRMGFGVLRVINDDTVAKGMGFDTHSHRDMEIISIPLEGGLEHKDSEGHSSVIKKGEVQVMSAGMGIRHSEFNASTQHEVKFLQIWVLPKKYQVKPHYDQRAFDFKENSITLIVSPDGREDSLNINQDAFFSIAKSQQGQSLNYERRLEGNGLYIFVLYGEIEGQGQRLQGRDGMGLDDSKNFSFRASGDCEVLLMEVPMNR